MFLNLLILSVILVAFLIAALSVKLIFGEGSSFETMTCHSSKGKNEVTGCAACDMKDIADCSTPNTSKINRNQKES